MYSLDFASHLLFIKGLVDVLKTFFQIQKVSRAATVFMHWTKAIYDYGADGQEILAKRKRIEEIDKELSSFEQEISSNKEIGLQGEVSATSKSSITCRNGFFVSINFRGRESYLKCWNTVSSC